MKVWINRNLCESNLAACESCFGQFLVTGVPDRPCIIAYQDDGRDTFTIFLRSGDDEETLIVPPRMREFVAYDGWSQYVSFEPQFRMNEGTARLARHRMAA